LRELEHDRPAPSFVWSVEIVVRLERVFVRLEAVPVLFLQRLFRVVVPLELAPDGGRILAAAASAAHQPQPAFVKHD